MLTEVALPVVQLRTVDVPGAMLLGCAVKVMVGVGPEVVTFTTVADAVVPPGPVAVAVYLVVAVGVTLTEPLAANEPTRLMLTEFASLLFQLSMVDVPLLTVLGDAFNVMAGACWLEFEAIDPPPHPIPTIHTANKRKNAEVRRKNRMNTPYG